MFSLVRTRLLFGLALVILGAGACTQNLEQNSTFQEQVSRLDKLDEKMKETSRQIASLDSDFQQVSKDVAQLTAKGAPGGSPGAAKALEQRMLALEKRLNDLNTQAAPPLAAVRPQPKPAAETTEATPATGPKTETSLAATAPVPGKKGKNGKLLVVGKTVSARKAAKLAKSRLKASAESAPVEASGEASQTEPASGAGSSGSYHMVQPGETLGKLAAKYGVKSGAILSANGLPSSAAVLPGQSIFIPRASQ